MQTQYYMFPSPYSDLKSSIQCPFYRVQRAYRPTFLPEQRRQAGLPLSIKFKGYEKLPVKLKAWLEKIHPVFSSYTPMLGDFPLKFPASTLIQDGTIAPFSFTYAEDAFRKALITKSDISFAEPESVVNILIDRSQDRHLWHYLNSPNVRQLARKVPTKKACADEEILFLKELSEMTKRQFDHLGIPLEVQKLIQDLDNFPQQTKAQRKKYEKQYSMNTASQNADSEEMIQSKPLRLLGDSMRRGVGVCCHKALLNKITLDFIKQKRFFNIWNLQDLKISYKLGLAQTEISKLFSAEEGHAWNVVQFPSGRKYLLDSISDLYAPYTKENSITKASQGSKTIYYISFNRLFKIENPNPQKL